MGGSDWSYIGDAPDSPLSIFLWYRRLMHFYPRGRAATDPFFMCKDRRRPYTYTAFVADLKALLKRVSPDDTDYGPHGIRVEGYNRSK